jgi:hypothetical protein
MPSELWRVSGARNQPARVTVFEVAERGVAIVAEVRASCGAGAGRCLAARPAAPGWRASSSSSGAERPAAES